MDKKLEKTQKVLNELKEHFKNSETKVRRLLQKEINEIKKTVQNMKEFNKDMESLKTKENQTETLEIKISLSQRLEVKKYN
jgi:signal transduction histidine kinase